MCGCGHKPPKKKKHQDWSVWQNDERLRPNINLPLEDLKRRLTEKGPCGVSLDDTVYFYVVSTTSVNANCTIYQHGCGPNFMGGIITLTNCKHDMRCSGNLKKAFRNGKLWVAGVTSKDKKKNSFQKRFLFFLMKVDSTIIANSFYDLWNQFNQVQNIRNIKDACNNPLGDLYRPKSNCNNKWDPNCYHPPRQDHVHYPDYMSQCNHRYRTNPNCWVTCGRNKKKEGCWAEDIAKYCNKNKNNRPLLLVGENPFMGKKKNSSCFLSFLWTKALIELDYSINLGHRHMSLNAFLRHLRSFECP